MGRGNLQGAIALRNLQLVVAGLALATSPSLYATDYGDASDLLLRNAQQNRAAQGTTLEVDGMIESVKPGNPRWYSLILELDNGNQITVIVYPKTKFWGPDYKSMAAAEAYTHLVQGQKIRMMHNTYLDAYLKHEMIIDLMFNAK